MSELTIDKLASSVSRIRENGLSVGLCHGCFDILHYGHILHFTYAKSYVDFLVVSVTSDEFVGKGPGRPIFTSHERMTVLSALKPVDQVYLNNSPTASRLLQLVDFDCYFKGSDYSNETTHPGLIREMESLSPKTKIVFTPTPKYSSTRVIELLNNY